MLRNYFTLYHLAFELQEILQDGYVFEVFSQQRNEITLSLITNQGEHLQLIVVTGHPKLCIYTREGINRKQRNTAALMPDITEKQISGVIIDPCDRIIYLQLEANYVIALQLFSAKTNVLLKKNGITVDAFKQGSTYATSSSRPEILPSLERLVYNRTFFTDCFTKTPSPTITAKLGKMLPGFDRQLVRVLLDRCGNNSSTEKLHTELSTLFYELLDPAPSVYIEGKSGPEFSILNNPPQPSVRLETVIEGLNLYSRKTWQYLKTSELVRELENKLKHKITKLERELGHFQPEKRRKQADEYERDGHLLMANLYSPLQQKDSITVADIFDPSAPRLTIPLKPELTIQQNAEVLFRKASKMKEKVEGGLERADIVKRQKNEIELLLESANKLATPLQVRDFYAANHATLKRLGLASRSEKDMKQLPFRRFDIPPKAVLYVGKNATNNEQLTFAFAKPHDIWLHARGAAGSHCILRGATMQNTTEIRKAAEIAAYYSSARHSELVPVIYTEKKYVRRTKNMPPGQVRLEREKVIMVRPSQDNWEQS